MAQSYIKRFTRLIFGLALFAFGNYLQVQAGVGLSPWVAFNQGVGVLTGLSIGTITILCGVVIIAIDYLIGEKIGFGTILNALLIGIFLDWFILLDFIPAMDGLVTGVPMLLVGLGITGLASYFYISAGMGCGPRDGLMVGLARRFPKTPVGVIRSIIEGTVLVVGWLCGATIGVGTVIAVFGLGAIIQTTFHIFRFDVTELTHENVFDTMKNLLNIRT